MSVDTRLSRLIPALTARERAILVLRSLKEKTPENPEWRSSMPREQASEFSRLISLINACNVHLPLFITYVEQHSEKLFLRFPWWHSVIGYGGVVWKLAQLIPAGKRRQAEKVVADVYPLVELPWDPQDRLNSWLNWSEGMLRVMRSDLVGLWEELRSIDILTGEVATEFDGEDPLRPVMRGVVEATRQRLIDLHELLSVGEPLELGEPGEEVLDLARLYFDKGKL